MKRIVVLVDGTWNEEGIGEDTNVASLDPINAKVLPVIKPYASDGTQQKVYYHKGVGAEPDFLKRILGGSIGLGLKRIVQDAYEFIVQSFASGDEIYIFGFSRGAYAARALAGLIGASGIHRTPSSKGFTTAWKHYRVKPAIRNAPTIAGAADRAAIEKHEALLARNAIHEQKSIKCVAVWDTVGSYGVPAGFGLAALARYISLIFLGFHDTSFGEHISVGLHGVAIDERRRPFVPTFWTIQKGKRPNGHVEQTWFAGVHCNVGGGYPDSGLSDVALIWMIARVQALTGLEFDTANVKATTTGANLDGEIYDSSKGWFVDKVFPYSRRILPRNAIHHGYFFNSENPQADRVNERIHWSVVQKRGRPCTIFGAANSPYEPPNVLSIISPERIAGITAEEKSLFCAAQALSSTRSPGGGGDD
jgi:uncharacterized protein (DUF2235 family)